MKAPYTFARLLLLTIALIYSVTPAAYADELEQALALYDLLEIEGTVQPAITQYADNLNLDADQRTDIFARYRVEVGTLMAEVYNSAELKALTDFYASETGQSVISKQGVIGEKYAEALIKVLSAYRQELDEQIPTQ